MKRSALIRIAVWSLAVVCLTSILLAGLGLRSYRSHTVFDRTDLAVTEPTEVLTSAATLGKAVNVYHSPSSDSAIQGELEAGTQIAIQRQEKINGMEWAYLNAPIQGWIVLDSIEYNLEPETLSPSVPPASETATLTVEATVYSSPSEEKGGHNGTLDAGAEITVTRRELVDNRQWVYTASPIQGWILAEHLDTEKVTVTEPVTPPENTYPPVQNGFGGSMLAENISNISIDWVAGNIHIIAGEGDRIALVETEGDQTMVWNHKNGKLSIDFCEESLLKGLRLGGTKAKDLTIVVPRDWICGDLEIDAASANLVLQDLTIRKVEIDAAKGTTEFIDCIVNALEMDAASGDVFFVGSLDTLEFDAASANFTATLNNKPRQMEVNSASGSLILTVPGDTGFSVRMEGLKNVFSADDFQITNQNGTYLHGDGACRIEMESMSGGVHIYKGN